MAKFRKVSKVKKSSVQVIDAKRTRGVLRDVKRNKENVMLDILEKEYIPDEEISVSNIIDNVLKHDLEENLSDDQETHFDETDREFELMDTHEIVAFNNFMSSGEYYPKGTANTFNLNYQNQKDNIDAVIEETENEKLPQIILDTYTKIGTIMSRYRSGSVPKAFKVLPLLERWDEIFALMNPDNWTAAAVFEATKYIISSGKDAVCEEFIKTLILPRIRDDIFEYKKLNYHMQRSLRFCTRKPAAFFKGFLFPLCEEKNCSLREACIIGGILRHTKVPILHSSVALLNIALMEYSGANSIFLRCLIEKNYALPYKVLDGLVNHFLKFYGEKRLLPVIWHQSFISFVELYGKYLAPEQRELLLDLCKKQTHHIITRLIKNKLMDYQNMDIAE